MSLTYAALARKCVSAPSLPDVNARSRSDLEAEEHLQIKAAVGRGGRIRAPSQAISEAENRRRDDADGCGNVYVVEEILRGDAERQTIFAVGRVARTEAAAWSSATATAASWTATEGAAAGSAQARIRGAFFLGTETEGFADAEVEAEASGAGAEVIRDEDVSRLRRDVETAQPGRNQIGWRARAATGPKRGPVVEYRIVVIVLTGRDVVRDTRTGNNKRAQTESIGQADGATEEQAIAYVVRSAAIILLDIVRVGSERIRAGSVGVGVIEHVVAE